MDVSPTAVCSTSFKHLNRIMCTYAFILWWDKTHTYQPLLSAMDSVCWARLQHSEQTCKQKLCKHTVCLLTVWYRLLWKISYCVPLLQKAATHIRWLNTPRVCRWVIYETFSKTSLTFRHPQKWTQWCQCQRHWPFYRLYPCLGLILCNPGRSPRSTGRPGRSCSCLDACSPYYDRTVQEWLWWLIQKHRHAPPAVHRKSNRRHWFIWAFTVYCAKVFCFQQANFSYFKVLWRTITQDFLWILTAFSLMSPTLTISWLTNSDNLTKHHILNFNFWHFVY